MAGLVDGIEGKAAVRECRFEYHPDICIAGKRNQGMFCEFRKADGSSSCESVFPGKYRDEVIVDE